MRQDNPLEIRKLIVLEHLKPPCERYSVLPARLKASYGCHLSSIKWTGSSFPLEWGSPENSHKMRYLHDTIPGARDRFDPARATAVHISPVLASPVFVEGDRAGGAVTGTKPRHLADMPSVHVDRRASSLEAPHGVLPIASLHRNPLSAPRAGFPSGPVWFNSTGHRLDARIAALRHFELVRLCG